MKTLLFLLLIPALVPALALAQTYDDDGLLNAMWESPIATYGDTLSHYQAELLVNGAAVWSNDSIPVPDTVLIDFYQLQFEGDWAILKVRSVATQGNYSVSTWAVSDTCYFDTGSPINPPNGLWWIVNGFPSPPTRQTDQR